MTESASERTINPMPTLRSFLKSAVARPSATTATSDPSPSPAMPDARGVGEGSLLISCAHCYGYGSAEILSRRPDALLVKCSRCGLTQWVNDPDEIVEGDGPQESGVSPSPSIDTDRLNKLLIEAAATMRESTDRLIKIRAVCAEFDRAVELASMYARDPNIEVIWPRPELAIARIQGILG